VVVLDRVHRHGRRIGAAADAIRAGDADGAVAALRAAPERITWIEADPAAAAAERTPVRAGVVEAAGAVIEAAQAGDARAALDRLGAYRLLCAHRRGPYGVAAWTDRIELWLTEDLPAFAADGPWYAGRPLLLTENDHALRLYNGDTGVVVRAEGELRAAFGRGRDVVTVRPSRLAAAETVYAMTVHKSQGSQFETTAVVLPPPSSPLLTRELLYTAVTRARERMVLVAEEASVRAAVARPAARASGLGARLGTVGSA
jgi:exodeoxyribonuclease V alpha subunit